VIPYLSQLYHWAPARLRETILREGLRISIPQTLLDERGDPCEVVFPWLCCGTTPWAAWNLLPDADAEDGDSRADGRGWDLWSIHVSEDDRLRLRDDFGPKLQEVRVLNSIPADRVWWVARRAGDPHLD
jgi:hypothetical protein